MSDSAILTSAGSSLHHCGAKTEKSRDYDDCLFLALSYGGARSQFEIVERNAQAGVCDLTNAWK